MVESQSTRGLIIISTLFKEGRIDEDQRDQLKGKSKLSSFSLIYLDFRHDLQRRRHFAFTLGALRRRTRYQRSCFILLQPWSGAIFP